MLAFFFDSVVGFDYTCGRLKLASMVTFDYMLNCCISFSSSFLLLFHYPMAPIPSGYSYEVWEV